MNTTTDHQPTIPVPVAHHTSDSPASGRPASGRPRPPRRHAVLWILLALLAGAAVAAGLPRLVSGSTGGSPSAEGASVEVAGTTSTPTPGEVVPGGPAQPAQPTTPQVPAGADPTDPVPPAVEQPAPPPVQPEPPAADPPAPSPALLQASPDPLKLPSGVYSGQILISNLGDEILDWKANSKPSVMLSAANGSLTGGSQAVLSFTVDKTTLADGAFTFKIKVWGNGGTTYVDVTGFKPFGSFKL